MVTEDYVSFEIAKLLKEKGFDEFCPTFYETNEPEPDNGPRYSKKLGWFLHNSYDYSDRYGKMIISAPTLQMALKWLRETYELYIEISLSCDREDKNAKIFDTSIFNVQNQRYKKLSNIQGYEEACEAAIKYCLENLI